VGIVSCSFIVKKVLSGIVYVGLDTSWCAAFLYICMTKTRQLRQVCDKMTVSRMSCLILDVLNMCGGEILSIWLSSIIDLKSICVSCRTLRKLFENPVLYRNLILRNLETLVKPYGFSEFSNFNIL
jgi:hypothetical protein